MIKIIIQLGLLYLILQYVVGIDVNRQIEELIDSDIEISELSDSLLNELALDSDLLEEINTEQLTELLERQGLSKDEIEDNLKQVQERLKEQFEKAKQAAQKQLDK